MREAIFLVNLHAAPMPVQIAVGANVHQDVKAELLSRAIGSQQFVMAATMAHAQVNDFLSPRPAQRDNGLPQLPVGMAGVLVQQRGCQLNFERLIVQQIDLGRRSNALPAHQLGFHLAQFLARGQLIGTRFGILHQRGRDAGLAQQLRPGLFPQGRVLLGDCLNQCQALSGIHVPGRGTRGLLHSFAQPAHFLVGAAEQARDLRLQGARVHNLSQRGVGRQRQQVAGNVKGARPQGALVGLLRHLPRLGGPSHQVLEVQFAEFAVLGKRETQWFPHTAAGPRDR